MSCTHAPRSTAALHEGGQWLGAETGVAGRRLEAGTTKRRQAIGVPKRRGDVGRPGGYAEAVETRGGQAR